MTVDYSGPRYHCAGGNIGSANDCRRVISEVIDQHGRLGIMASGRSSSGSERVRR